MELTVSVSTVIFLAEPSAEVLPRLKAEPVLCDLVGAALFGGIVEGGASEAARILISPLFPPLSLPLSAAAVPDLDFNGLAMTWSIALPCSSSCLTAPCDSSREPSRLNAGVLG